VLRLLLIRPSMGDDLDCHALTFPHPAHLRS
jgi:hypothetical protein